MEPRRCRFVLGHIDGCAMLEASLSLKLVVVAVVLDVQDSASSPNRNLEMEVFAERDDCSEATVLDPRP